MPLNINKSKRAPNVAALLAIIAVICAWLLLVHQLEGEYSGHLLDALSSQARLVLKDGVVYIQDPDGKRVKSGAYNWQTNGLIYHQGPNLDWILERNLWGFAMIDSTNSEIRYSFVKSWLPFRLDDP